MNVWSGDGARGWGNVKVDSLIDRIRGRNIRDVCRVIRREHSVLSFTESNENSVY